MTEEFQWNIHLDGVGISLYNLGVYFQSNTGKLISQLITLVVAVRLFSFFGDENLTFSAKIGSTINVKIGIMLDWIYILAEINHSQIMSNLYISAGLKWNSAATSPFCSTHTNKPVSNKGFLLTLHDSSLSGSRLEGLL